MTLHDLLTMQTELQTHSDQQPQTIEQIYLAQMAELGEIVQCVKWGVSGDDERPAWAWWHRASKVPAQRDELAGELADLLCFVLLAVLEDAPPSSDEWTEAWQKPVLLRNGDSSDLYAAAWGCVTSVGVEWFVQLCRHFGFTQADIEAAYQAAYDKNVARWADK